MKKILNFTSELHPEDSPSSKIVGRHKDRLKQTIEFVSDNTRFLGHTLTIGQKGIFDRLVYNSCSVEDCFVSHFETTGDLDTLDWRPEADRTFNTVFAFEVFEHIVNPQLFLSRVRDYLTKDGIIFVSIPNHLLRRHWRTLHYHEIDPVRFKYICDKSGFEIVDYKKYKYYPRLTDINGVRPLLRYITGYSWFISRVDRHFYAIKTK